VEPDYRLLMKLLRGEIDAICALAGGSWDHAPAVILVEEAGGKFTDPDGGRRLDLGGGIFSNGRIHDQLRAVVD
jgi:histidinol-phosphatase